VKWVSFGTQLSSPRAKVQWCIGLSGPFLEVNPLTYGCFLPVHRVVLLIGALWHGCYLWVPELLGFKRLDENLGRLGNIL
jgi:hypothetical protein